MFASNSNSEVSIFCTLFSSLNLLVAVCLSIERRFYSLARAEDEDKNHIGCSIHMIEKGMCYKTFPYVKVAKLSRKVLHCDYFFMKSYCN